MTKQNNNYKAKFGKKRKKPPGRQYRPPVMPNVGDIYTKELQKKIGRSMSEQYDCECQALQASSAPSSWNA